MPKRFSQEEVKFLKENYPHYRDSGKLSELSNIMGRQKSSLARKARELGMVDQARARIVNANIGAEKRRGKKIWEVNEHPRGMAGKKHSQETLVKLSEASKKSAASKTHEEKSAIALKAQKTKEANGWRATHSRGATWKAGWREIGGKSNYYRSRWEANYARYLETLKAVGEISEWAHEPETFWFDAIKRGVRSYKPDFRVWMPDGSSCLHEVKGWMDSRSATTLKRMKKYHPEQKIILVDTKAYNAIARRVKFSIEGWEMANRKSLGV